MDKFRRFGIIIAILVILACGYAIFHTIFGESKGGIVVPQLVGMQMQEAADTLQKLGLSAKVEKIDSAEPADTVISQDVNPGKSIKNSKALLLQVSRGAAQTKIPDVRFMVSEDAVRRLEEAGFKVEKIIRVNDPQRKEGTVLAQNPSAEQKVDSGCKVELLVCTGGASEGMQNVPDLRGKTTEEATEMLQKVGLVIGEMSTISSSGKEGTVVSTKPNIGTRVQSGSTINLILSDGTEKKNVPVVSEPTAPKDNIVRVVKAEVKESPQKKEQKVEAKIADKKTDTKAADKKTEPKTAEKKIDTKATDVKAEAKKTESKPVVKTETKTEVKAETKPEAKAEVKTAVAQQQPTEAKVETPSKSGKIRYTIPPLTSPLNLKITMQDAEGSHVLQDTTVKESKTISIPFKYKEKASVSVILGGETVWQENYK